MYVDLLNSNNYISINLSLIKLFGLKGAAYISELLNIFKKAVIKNKLKDDGYAVINRKYISERIGVLAHEQHDLDIKLQSLSLVSINSKNKDIISIDTKGLVSLIVLSDNQDEQLTSDIIADMRKNFDNKNTKETNEIRAKSIHKVLKNSVVNLSPKIKQAIYSWIDASDILTKNDVIEFQDKLLKYTKDELIAIKIIEIAIKYKFGNVDLAINKYEQEIKNAPRCTTQLRATKEDMEKGRKF